MKASPHPPSKQPSSTTLVDYQWALLALIVGLVGELGKCMWVLKTYGPDRFRETISTPLKQTWHENPNTTTLVI